MQEAMTEDERSFEQKVEEELANMDPASLRYLEQLFVIAEKMGKIDLPAVEYFTQFGDEDMLAVRKLVQKILGKKPTSGKKKLRLVSSMKINLPPTTVSCANKRETLEEK